MNPSQPSKRARSPPFWLWSGSRWNEHDQSRYEKDQEPEEGPDIVENDLDEQPKDQGKLILEDLKRQLLEQKVREEQEEERKDREFIGPRDHPARSLEVAIQMCESGVHPNIAWNTVKEPYGPLLENGDLKPPEDPGSLEFCKAKLSLIHAYIDSARLCLMQDVGSSHSNAGGNATTTNEQLARAYYHASTPRHQMNGINRDEIVGEVPITQQDVVEEQADDEEDMEEEDAQNQIETGNEREAEDEVEMLDQEEEEARDEAGADNEEAIDVEEEMEEEDGSVQEDERIARFGVVPQIFGGQNMRGPYFAPILQTTNIQQPIGLPPIEALLQTPIASLQNHQPAPQVAQQVPYMFDRNHIHETVRYFVNERLKIVCVPPNRTTDILQWTIRDVGIWIFHAIANVEKKQPTATALMNREVSGMQFIGWATPTVRPVNIPWLEEIPVEEQERIQGMLIEIYTTKYEIRWQ